MSSTLPATTEPNYYDDVYASLPTIVAFVYLGIVVFSFICIAIYAVIKLRSDDFKINCALSNWFSLILDLRKIYLHAVIHLADTVSDVAVICQFYRLAVRERNDDNFNVPGLDMTGLFVGTVVCLLIYRIFTAYHLFYIAGGSLLLFLIQFLDLGVFLCIYLAWRMNRIEPIFWQDYLTHVEALFESIPQILIQSQFVLRSGENNAIVVASIMIAFVSVVTRFVKSDFPFIDKDSRALLLVDEVTNNVRSPYISWGFLVIYALRTSEIIVRLVCAVFLWAVLGFIPLAICLFITMVISQRFLWKTKSQRFLFWYIAIPLECISVKKRKHIYVRCIENWIYLTIISIYSYEAAWCLTCATIDDRNKQINPDAVVFSLGYIYLFSGWLCSFLTPILWFIVWRTGLYIGKHATPEDRREEIMSIPRLFYRKRGCYKPTVTPLHFAVHRKFTKQIVAMLKNDEVEINAIRISGATALHSAVGRSLRDVAEILLKHGADFTIVKKEVWYFRCCMPWKWCGRNWYQGKTALEIARYKVEQEEKILGKELDDDHRYKQVLALLENPPSKDDKTEVDDLDEIAGRTHTHQSTHTMSNGLEADGIVLVTKNDSQVVGNEEDDIGMDLAMEDAEQQHIQPQFSK